MDQHVRFAPLPPYNSETNCLQTDLYTYSLTSNGIDGYLSGGEDIYNMLKDMNVGTELYIDCETGHGLDRGAPYQSNFGVPTNADMASTGAYIAGRAATFFQAIMNSSVGLFTTTKFAECEHDRYGCSKADNYECSGGRDPGADYQQ
jgi:hypothetical protein